MVRQPVLYAVPDFDERLVLECLHTHKHRRLAVDLGQNPVVHESVPDLRHVSELTIDPSGWTTNGTSLNSSPCLRFPMTLRTMLPASVRNSPNV